MNEDDNLILLGDKQIKYCKGCNMCLKEIHDYCSQQDDMKEIYGDILKADKIIIASPIYFDFITGLLKNFVDRLMPLNTNKGLSGKRIYLITIGEMSEAETKGSEERIKSYFEYLSDSFEFELIYLRTL
jgi:multimeric flavodoxin WrbA